jgi:hypothetical protein
MTKRLVNKGVTVVRDGKRVRPEIGKNFDFTADEITRITDVEPTALSKADAGEDGEATSLRRPPRRPPRPTSRLRLDRRRRAKAAGKAAGKSTARPLRRRRKATPTRSLAAVRAAAKLPTTISKLKRCR